MAILLIHRPLAPTSWVLVRGTEDAERGFIFWRIGERPILQKPHGSIIELPQWLWTFDLAGRQPGANQKIPSLRSQRLCGEMILFLIGVSAEPAQNFQRIGRNGWRI